MSNDVVFDIKMDAHKFHMESRKVASELKELTKVHYELSNAIKKADQSAESIVDDFIRMQQTSAKTVTFTKRLGSGIDGLAAKSDRASSSFQKMSTALAAVGRATVAVFAFKSLGHNFSELVTDGHKFSNMMKSLKININGADAALYGLVDRMELARLANNATALGVVKTGDAFADLAKETAIAAQRLGRDQVDAMQRVILGIGKLEVKLLDELGVRVRINEIVKKYALANDVATTSVDTKKRQELLAIEVLKSLRDANKGVTLSVKGTAVQLKKTSNAWKDLWRQMGKSLDSNQLLSEAFGGLALILSGKVGLTGVTPKGQIAAGAMNVMPGFYEGPRGPDGKLLYIGDILRANERRTGVDYSKYKNYQYMGKGGDAGEIKQELEGGMNWVGHYDKGIKVPKYKKPPRKPRGRKAKKPTWSNVAEDDWIDDQFDKMRLQIWKKLENKWLDMLEFVGDSQLKAFETERDRLGRLIDADNQKRGWINRTNASRGINAGENLSPGGGMMNIFTDMSKNLQWAQDPNQGRNGMALAVDRLKESIQELGGAASATFAVVGNGLTGAFGNFTDAVWEAFTANKALGDTLEQVFHIFLKNFSKEMFLQSLKQTGLGIASLIFNPVEASSHFSAAAVFAGAAAATGLAARASAPTEKKKITKSRGVSRGRGGSAMQENIGGPQQITFQINTLMATADEEQFARALGTGLRLAKQRGYA